MIDLENPQKQNEWLGTKPDSHTRMIIVVATITSIIILATFILVQHFVGFSGTSGGLFIGILGGLLTSGLLASISWAVYDQFLPAYLHQKYQPKIDGRWFGYYSEEYN